MNNIKERTKLFNYFVNFLQNEIRNFDIWLNSYIFLLELKNFNKKL